MARTSAPLLRTSERSSFKRCRWAWNQAFNVRIKSKHPTPALKFGDLVHQALAAYYKPGLRRGTAPAETFQRLFEESRDQGYAEGLRDSEGNWEEMGELGTVLLEAYLAEYHERDKQYKVLSSEQTFRVPIKGADGKLLVTYVGTFDGVWEDRAGGAIFFPEHKTASAIALDGLPLDEQAGSYWTYGPKWLRRQGILKEGQNLSHIMYNYLRKGKPDARPKNELGQSLNQDGSVSKNQPSPLFVRQVIYRDEADRREMHNRVLAEAREMRECRADPSRVYKNPGPLHMPNCRGCGYRDMCELHETGNDWEAMRDATMEPWNPYDAHELVERR